MAHNNKYRALRISPPKLEVSKQSREVIFTTISCMCDNVGTLRFRKNDSGDFKMSGMGFALSNWQMKHTIHDIEWAADAGEWKEVIKMINSGTEAIEKVKSR